MKKIKNNKVIGTGKLSDKDAKFLEELNRRGQAPEAASLKIFNYLKKTAAGKKNNVRAELKAVLKNKKKNPGRK